MEIYPVEAGPVYTIGYLVYDPDSAKAILIDAPLDCSHAILEFLGEKKLELEKIILTHTHWDHMGDAAELSKETGAEVLCHQADAYRLDDPNEHAMMFLPFDINPVDNRTYINEGDMVKVGNIKFSVVHTPGHTEGGICLVNKPGKTIFSGDTLFLGSIGRTDLRGGDTETLLDSIRTKLFTLGDDYRVYPGHGSDTTIGVERKSNIFFQKK